MNVVIGRRGQGKTELLVKMAADSKAVIVAATEIQAKYIKGMAENMGLDIPKPISWHTFITKSQGRREAYLLDELGSILSGLNIKAATLDESQVMYMGSK